MASIAVSKKQLKEIQRRKELQDDVDGDAVANHDHDHDEDEHNASNHNGKRPQRRRRSSAKKKRKRAKGLSVEVEENENGNGNEDKVGMGQMEGGFFFAECNTKETAHSAARVQSDNNNHRSDGNVNGKEERSDSEEELVSRPLRRLQDADEDGQSDGQMDENLHQRLQESNEFHKFPRNVARMTAEDIARLPASMQYEIMQKRRELLRHKTRPEFFKAAESPTKYAEVQLRSFLKTSSLNQRIEALRKQTADEFNRQLVADVMGEGDVGTIGRIASDGSKMYMVKETKDDSIQSGRFRFQWMDRQTKEKRREYLQRQRQKRKRRGKWALQSDYVARTLKIEMETARVGNAAASSSMVFKHWSCPICKYLNLRQRRKCDVCGMVQILYILSLSMHLSI